MPIIKSAIKRSKQEIRRRANNRLVKTEFRTLTKNFLIEVKAGNYDQEQFKKVVSSLDRAVKKGVLHRNTVARKKSSLTKAANTVRKSSNLVTDQATKSTVKPKTEASTKPATKKAVKKSTKISQSKKTPAKKAPVKKSTDTK
ncbi:30S ribosomal protein S20 [Candidatus Saccharibacteria bacterium]|nr:30S ribosomal protein S20 [Candidatus Saccharibacteria bacterium]